MRILRVKKSPSSRQTGDTIVEVIIAVAIVSSILAGAFLVATNSQRAIRDSEEHAEALQLLQGQVELLRAAAGTSGVLKTLPPEFCLSGTTVQPTSENDPGSCEVNSTYHLVLSIQVAQLPTRAGDTTTFNLFGKWDRLGGGNDQVELDYKVYVES